GRDVLALHRLIEARPAGARVELGVRAEKLVTAADAAENALLVVVVVFAREGPFGALLAHYLVLLRRELVLPILLALDHFLHRLLLGSEWRFSSLVSGTGPALRLISTGT